MRISRDFTFCASHILPRHPGKCGRLHGHNWVVRVELEGPVQKESQFVVDYAELSDIVEPLIERWDHRHLNCFVRYPSAENLAAHLADLLRPRLSGELNQLIVAVSETQKTWAVWDSANREDLLMLDHASEDAEWRSPDVPIPLHGKNETFLEGAIERQDEKVKALLEQLHKEMTAREQYQLYLDSLTVPELPEELQKGKIQ